MEEKLEGGGHFRSFMKVLKSLYALLTLSATSICSASQCPIELSQFGTDVKGNVESFAKRFHNKPIYVAAKQDGSCELFFETEKLHLAMSTDCYTYSRSRVEDPFSSEIVLSAKGELFWNKQPIQMNDNSAQEGLKEKKSDEEASKKQQINSLAGPAITSECRILYYDLYTEIKDVTDPANRKSLKHLFGYPFLEDAIAKKFTAEDGLAIKSLIKTGYSVKITAEEERGVVSMLDDKKKDISCYFFKGIIAKN